ncbi:MAG: polyamine aminopropyltransferase [Candidatus Caldatribacteriota bacterium]
MKDKEVWIEDQYGINQGRSLKIKIVKSIERIKSDFQEIEVLESKPFGKVLLIDGIIMLTEADEFCYHEMITHIPLCVHPQAKKVLVIGGGDGGTVREILKHQEVNEIDICEIDQAVIELSKKHLPNLANSFGDNRVKIYHQDGSKFIQEHKNEYDVIIVDSSDPIGPAEVLFKREFYEDMYLALKKEGIVVTQAESFFYDQEIIRSLFSFIKEIYPIAEYYYTMVPTYPSGVIGFTFCSKKYHPIKDFNLEKTLSLKNLKYYNPEIHRSSFVLPNFAQKLK